MADIAKAYVQIIPSAEGIKGNLTEMFGGEAASAGMAAGSSFAGGMGKAIGAAKIGATAVAATGAIVTAATGALVRGASGVAEYGDNIDKMSQKMGISAQAYQEWDAIMQHSGTSIDALKPSMKTLAQQAQKGAEEFQALGISEEEVKNLSQEDLFAKVITGLQGMEEGTERTAITSRLLGRGATELGALLNTSAEDTEAMRQKLYELGGVMSDDAVKASAQFQDTLQDMGTGFDSLKRNMLSEFLPAVTTVMDGMTDIFTGDSEAGLEKMSSGITEFVGNLTNILPDFLNVAANIVMALGEGIIQNLPALTDAVINVIGQLGNMIIQNLPLLLETGLQIILTLANSISQALPTLIPTIVSVILEMVNILIQNIDLLVDAGIQLITGLALGLIQALPVLMEKAPEIIMALVEAIIQNLPTLIMASLQMVQTLAQGISENLPQIIEMGIQIVVSLVAGLIQMLPQIVSTSLQLIGSIKDTFMSINWLELGLNIIKGIVKGIVSGAAELVNAIKGLATKALESAKSAFKIHSPSALFRDDVGQMIGLGVVEGIEDTTNPIMNAMSNLSDMSVNRFNAASMLGSGAGYRTAELAPAGMGDLTIPVYIGNKKFETAVVNANQMNTYRSGGR